MKYKYEDTIKNISMFAFVLTMILMKVGNVSVQMFLAATSCMICTFGAIYCAYKGFKMGAEILLCLALIGVLVMLSQYFDSYKIAVLIPAMFIVFFIIGYRMIVKIGDKEQIMKMKKKAILGVILCLIFQIVMIIPLFIKI